MIIEAVIDLLQKGSPALKEAAVAVLRNLASDFNNKAAIVQMGGLPLLVHVLDVGTPAARKYAAGYAIFVMISYVIFAIIIIVIIIIIMIIMINTHVY